MNKYFVLTSRGLEDVARAEIESKLSDIEIAEVSYRKVVFSYGGEPNQLLNLRSVEDAFLLLAKFEQVNHTRDSLGVLVGQIEELDFRQAIKIIQLLRDHKINEFSISASSVGKRNFTYIEVKDALSKKITKKLGWVYDNERHQEFDIRVFLEHSIGLIGVRLAERPLHRRLYKIATTKATLRSDIAYCMGYVAGIKNTDIVLDPMCGSGSILIEASTFNPKKIIGGDINLDAVHTTQENIASLNSTQKFEIIKWDATHLPLADHSIDKLLCNLPFGKQIEVGDLGTFYTLSLKEFGRVIKPGGIMVLLTSYENFVSLIPKELRNIQTYQTNLNGEVVNLVVIQA